MVVPLPSKQIVPVRFWSVALKERNTMEKQYTEEEERALRDLDAASQALRKSAGGKAGESAEKRYGEAYAKCYKLGLKQWPPTVCRTTA